MKDFPTTMQQSPASSLLPTVVSQQKTHNNNSASVRSGYPLTAEMYSSASHKKIRPFFRSHVNAFHAPMEIMRESQYTHCMSPSSDLNSKSSLSSISSPRSGGFSGGHGANELPLSLQSFSLDDHDPVPMSKSPGSLQLSDPVLVIRRIGGTSGTSRKSSFSRETGFNTPGFSASPHSPQHSPRHTRHPTSAISLNGPTSEPVSPRATSPEKKPRAVQIPGDAPHHGHTYGGSVSLPTSPVTSSYNGGGDYKLHSSHFSPRSSVDCVFPGKFEGLASTHDHPSRLPSCDPAQCTHHHHRESTTSIVSIACHSDGAGEIAAEIVLAPVASNMLVPLIDRTDEMKDLIAHPANKMWARRAENVLGKKQWGEALVLWCEKGRNEIPDLAWLQTSREMLTTVCGGGGIDGSLWSEFCGMVGWDETEESVLDGNGWRRRYSWDSYGSNDSGAMSSIAEDDELDEITGDLDE